MLNTLKLTTAAAALAMVPVMGSAATVVPGGGPYDVLADSYDFNTDLGVGSAGQTLSFDFFNGSGSTAAVTFFGYSVLQQAAFFTGGVQFDFGGMFTSSVAESAQGGFDATSFLLGAGQSATLTVTYGDVVDRGPSGGTADIDFTVEAAVVPVPAAGLLLLTALGGAAALRRRKAAA